MIDNTEVKEYRKEKSMKLFSAYKDLIEKTFEVIDKDLLQEKIDDDEDEKQSEQRFLDAIQKRRKALDEVDVMLDKVEKLERGLKSDDDDETPAHSGNIAKEKAAAKKANQPTA